MNRLERLLNLVAALIDTERPLPREEIERRVPGYDSESAGTRRAFERDKDTLRSMGIPISVEPLDPRYPEQGTGYRIRREQYELPDPGLTADELAALHLAASTVRLEGGGATEAIWKLGGAAGGTAGDPAAAAAGTAALPGSEHLAPLFAAVSERRTVRFRYRDAEREVDPWRLSFGRGFWYLHGFDRGRGGERNFRLDRLQSPPSPGPPGAFERPGGRSPRRVEPWEMGDEEPVTATLLVDADQAEWMTGRLGAGELRERTPEGEVVVALRVTNRGAFRSLVLGFLDHAEVLGPPELRDDLVAWLEAIAQ